MTGVRFYLEHETPAGKRKGKHNGNVFAALVCNGRMSHGGFEGLGSVFSDPNSPVASTSASRDFLRKLCKRIPEGKAREIHPNLFYRLDGN